ncbi:preprotein translocase subunit SecG [Candidatus Dojkabacteria bacterium]|nr:preprotein translocase subunit SecG [Candidatus Dojkabacteria bacterium]
MEIKNVLQISEAVIAILLSLVVLLQQGGGGLGTVFGGGGGDSYRSKRGLEAGLSRMTIFLAVLFVINSIALALVLSR